jgi:hypothetical protein
MAAVIEDAHRRQRRRRIATAVVIVIACAATAIALAVVPSNGRGRSAAERPGQQVGQVWWRPDGHLIVLAPNGRVLKHCVLSRTFSSGTHGSAQSWIAVTNVSRTMRLPGTPPHCRT